MKYSSNSSLITTIQDLPALVNNLLLLLSEKEKVVIKKRFNLDGKRKYTLDEIGKDFSVTRERIRQIEKNALLKMKRNVFNTGFKTLHDFSYQIVRDHGGLIKEETYFSELGEALPENVKLNKCDLHLSLVLHENLECVGNTINFYPYVKEKGLSDGMLKDVSEKLIKKLNKHGDVKKLNNIFTEISSDIKEPSFDKNKTKSLIDIDKRIAVLDDDLVALLEWRHIHPRTLRDKILFILRKKKEPMHFVEISNQISNAKFDERPINVQAVHNELIRHSQFVLIGRGIYALQEWGYEKGTVSEIIHGILKEHKELPQDKIIELVFKQRQVKKITILLSLKNNKEFERIGRKVYKLKKTKS